MKLVAKQLHSVVDKVEGQCDIGPGYTEAFVYDRIP